MMLSSTATTLINMTNSTVTPAVLRLAGDSDTPFWIKASLGTILLLGLAFCCLRKPTMVSMISRNQQQRLEPVSGFSSKEESKECTPLLAQYSNPAYRDPSEANDWWLVKGDGAVEIQMETVTGTRYDLSAFVLEEDDFTPARRKP